MIWKLRDVRALPIVAGLVMLVATVVIWDLLADREQQQIEQTIAQEVDTATQQVSARFESRIHALERLASRWEFRGRPTRAQWEFEARLEWRDFAGFQAIEWVDPTYQVRWVVPEQGNEVVLGTDIRTDERQQQVVDAARNRGATAISEPVDLPHGGRGILIVHPIVRPLPGSIHLDGRQMVSDGFIVGVVRIEELFSAIVDGSVAPGYSIATTRQGEEIYARISGGRQHEEQWAQNQSFSLAGGDWSLRLWPEPETLAQEESNLPEVVLGTGLLATVLLAGTIYLAQASTRRQEQAQTLSRQLEDEIQVRERIERDLRSSKVALERSNRDLQEFAYVASHDLKAPLLSLRGLTGILVEDYGNSLDGEARMYLDRVSANAEKMQTLLDDLLEFSRIGRTDSDLTSVDLNAVVRTIIEQQSHNLDARNAEVSIEHTLPVVTANRGRMAQVFTNLIDNALKYTPADREARIDIGARECDDHWELFVQDNGVGIPEEDRDKVYTMFQRLSGGRSLNPGGSGMGLAIVARIVEHHGGKIWIESEEGAGSTFFFTLEKQKTTSDGQQPASPDGRRLVTTGQVSATAKRWNH